MKNTLAAIVTEPLPATPHRYQIYRQARNGLYHNHGSIIDSPEDAVALFLQTSPAFEGGGLRLWDRHDQRHVASADWHLESTRMGFSVRLRSNVFHDPALAEIAERIAEREAIEQSITSHIRMTA
jgi:hypothetical protein